MFWLDLIFASVLGIFFVYRTIVTRKAMPGVPMVILSVAAVGVALWGLHR